MRKKSFLLGMIFVTVLALSGCGEDKNEKTTAAVTEIVSTENLTESEDKTEETTEVTMETTTEATQATEIKIAVVGDGLNESQEYYENMYRDVLNFNYKTLSGGTDNYEYAEGTSGIGEIVMNGSENAIDIVGYTFIDSNDDDNETDDKLLQSMKQFSPIKETESGITISFNEVQYLNA